MQELSSASVWESASVRALIASRLCRTYLCAPRRRQPPLLTADVELPVYTSTTTSTQEAWRDERPLGGSRRGGPAPRGAAEEPSAFQLDHLDNAARFVEVGAPSPAPAPAQPWSLPPAAAMRPAPAPAPAAVPAVAEVLVPPDLRDAETPPAVAAVPSSAAAPMSRPPPQPPPPPPQQLQPQGLSAASFGAAAVLAPGEQPCSRGSCGAAGASPPPLPAQPLPPLPPLRPDALERAQERATRRAGCATACSATWAPPASC